MLCCFFNIIGRKKKNVIFVLLVALWDEFENGEEWMVPYRILQQSNLKANEKQKKKKKKRCISNIL
jgi:hypothetical protein